MKKTHLVLLLVIITNSCFSQERNCNCIDELNNVAEQIKYAKSYKDQISKVKEADFNKWKIKIEQEIENDSLIEFFCIGYLQKYISFINDRHNEIYFVPEKISSNIPTYPKPIDTLQIVNDKVSGKYYAGTNEILVKKENDSIWYGITLHSNSGEWTEGKIRLQIKKNVDGNFELFEYYQNGSLFYQNNVKIANGRIHSTFWNKQNKYFFNKNFQENFTYQPINSSFDYVGIKTLKRTTHLMKEAAAFYSNNLKKMTKENLIIDLRNNGGGSTKQAETLLNYLKHNEKIKNIYVLINFKTSSAGELTALKLKADKRTIIAGENSRGMLEYGYGNKAYSSETDCSAFKIVLSTKQNNRKLSKYEYVGIIPDYYLNNKSDWVDQIVSLDSK